MRPRAWRILRFGRSQLRLTSYPTQAILIGMTRKKKGKNIRIPDVAIGAIEVLRASMLRTQHVGGLRIRQVVSLGDGTVIAFALVMCELLLDPKFALIDREKCLDTFDREIIKRLPEFANRTEDERRALLDLLMSSCCEFTAYDPDANLRAAPTGTGLPS